MIKRLFDIIVSLLGIIILLPVFIFVSIAILIDSKGPIFYLQNRVGLNFKEFKIFKFRTMYEFSDLAGLLTVGHKDSRITRVGHWLRRLKLDEIPQLFNVLLGSMSLVGPRPEVKKYVDKYTDDQKRVLMVKPGITDLASIQFIDENEYLLKYADPEMGYIKEVMPLKLKFNLDYIKSRSVFKDLKIICLTITKIVSRKSLKTNQE